MHYFIDLFLQPDICFSSFVRSFMQSFMQALNIFITSFLQTAAYTNFLSNQLHCFIFRKHVLGEEDVPGVPTQPPPYFSQEMFSIVKKVHEESSINIITMTEKDWSRLLTKEYITMEHSMGNDIREMRKCKSTLDCPETDFVTVLLQKCWGWKLDTYQKTWNYPSLSLLLPPSDTCGSRKHPP